jgi:hypothetical protein
LDCNLCYGCPLQQSIKIEYRPGQIFGLTADVRVWTLTLWELLYATMSGLNFLGTFRYYYTIITVASTMVNLCYVSWQQITCLRLQLSMERKMAIWIKRSTQYHSLHLALQHTRYKVCSGPTQGQEIVKGWTPSSAWQTPGLNSLESSTMTSTSSSLTPCELLIWSSMQIRNAWVMI